MNETSQSMASRMRQAGWQRHDWMVNALALALSPACMARGALVPGTDGRRRPARIGEAYDTARSSVSMMFQLPG